MTEHPEPPCDHVWRFSNSRNAFYCTRCGEIDEAQ